MPLDYRTPPEFDPDREHEPPQWWVLALALAVGLAVIGLFVWLRFLR